MMYRGSFMKNAKLAALCVLSLASVAALADNLLGVTKAVNSSFTPCATADLDLSSAAGNQTVFNFNNPIAGLVTVHFSAECAAGGNPNQFVAVNIFVDPAPVTAGPGGDVLVTPSGASNALCSGNNTAGLDGWVDASVRGVISLPVGISSVRIQKVAGGGSPSCWVSDTSLVVER
jgi:hypothetical protein